MRFTLPIVILAATATPAFSADITGRATVIDGDTIEIHGTRIRLEGVDAPESHQVCVDAKKAPYRCGQISTIALEEFLAKSRPTSCSPTGTSYDRVVASCRWAERQRVAGAERVCS